MIDPVSLNIILSAVSGPAAGLVVALLCMAGFGYFLIKHLLPQQERMLNASLEDSRKNRKVFQDAIQVMDSRLDKVENGLITMNEQINLIRNKL